MSIAPSHFSKSTLAFLKRNGWFPGRNSGQLPPGSHIFPKVERIIREFGGLNFSERATGETLCMALPETAWCWGLSYAASRFSHLLGKNLCVVGYLEFGEVEFVAVDNDGVIYTLNILQESATQGTAELKAFAANFDDFIEFYVANFEGTVQFQKLKEGLESFGLAEKFWSISLKNLFAIL